MGWASLGPTLRLWLLVAVFAVFLEGYFPGEPVDREAGEAGPLPAAWQRRVGRLVVVVIDALRADWVLESEGGNVTKIKFLAERLAAGEAVGLVTVVSPPTVTLPRIKAITTGSVPGFRDVVRNFHSSSLAGDSLVRQWQAAHRTVLCYGDDTWARLFPGMFARQDPVTSFFVSDYTEVDHNVTRHLEAELDRQDWDVMILHYLGLDHIGHLAGPASPLVPAKLDEMSDVLERVWTSLQKDTTPSLPPLLVVLGDHGMADGGGHGGASAPEVRVPLVAVGAAGPVPSQALQVDIAPSLAAATGVPAPRGSRGRVLPGLLPPALPADTLQLLRHSALQLQEAGMGQEGRVELLQAETELAGLKESPSPSQQARLVRLYQDSAMVAQQALLGRGGEQKLPQLILSIIGLATSSSVSPTRPRSPVVILAFLLVLSFSLFTSIVAFCKIILFFFLSIASLQSLLNGTVTESLRNLKSCLADRRWSSLFLLLAVKIHLLSLLSSSFIEEEHQTVYFLFTTFLVIVLLESNCSFITGSLILIVHKILRNFNQTGDKWSHVPDLSDYFNKDENVISKQFLLFVSVFLIPTVLSNFSKKLILLDYVFSFSIFFQKIFLSRSNFIAQLNFFFLFCEIFRTDHSRIVKQFLTLLRLVMIVQSDISH